MIRLCRRRTRTLVVTLACVTGLLAVPPASHGQSFELSPIVGMRFGGLIEAVAEGDTASTVGGVPVENSAAYSLEAGFRLTDETLVTVLFSRQPTDLEGTRLVDPSGSARNVPMDVDYIHVGGVYEWKPEEVRGTGFVFSSVGLTRFAPDGFDSDTHFSFAAGGGAKLPLGRRVKLRLQAALYLSFLGSEGDVFCTGGEGLECLVTVRGDVFAQGELAAGLVFAF